MYDYNWVRVQTWPDLVGNGPTKHISTEVWKYFTKVIKMEISTNKFLTMSQRLREILERLGIQMNNLLINIDQHIENYTLKS